MLKFKKSAIVIFASLLAVFPLSSGYSSAYLPTDASTVSAVISPELEEQLRVGDYQGQANYISPELEEQLRVGDYQGQASYISPELEEQLRVGDYQGQANYILPAMDKNYGDDIFSS